MKLLYAGASCIVMVGGGLSRPIPVTRGIDRGVLIRATISIAIEPLFCKLREKILCFLLHLVLLRIQNIFKYLCR